MAKFSVRERRQLAEGEKFSTRVLIALLEQRAKEGKLSERAALDLAGVFYMASVSAGETQTAAANNAAKV